MRNALLQVIAIATVLMVASCGNDKSTPEDQSTELTSTIRTELPTLDQILKQENSINTFIVALDSAKMSWVLRGDKDSYVIFAPNDNAFEALGPGAVDKLLDPDNRDELFKLVRRHIIKGRFAYELMQSGMQAESESREKLIFINNEEEELTVNGVKVVKSNIEGSNGFVHIVDRVIF